LGSERREQIYHLAVTRFSPGLGGHRELRVDVAAPRRPRRHRSRRCRQARQVWSTSRAPWYTAVAGVAAGGSAAVAILTQATAAAAIAVIGLAVMVVTLRRPNPWLATTKDLTTLSLSDDDLDACFAAARRSRTGRERSETEAVLDSVTLVLPGRRWRVPDVPTVRFRVREPEGSGWHILAFDRPPQRPARVKIGAGGGQSVGAVTVPPWRLDASWRQLVALSWLRMQPFVGTVVLEPLPGSRGRRRHWEISYRSAEPARRGETTSFRLRSTGLYRPASTRRARGGAAAAVGDRQGPSHWQSLSRR